MRFTPRRCRPTCPLSSRRAPSLVVSIVAAWVAIGIGLVPRSGHADDTAKGIVAVVNAEPITYKTLADEALRRYGQDQLESMINRHLILQACQEQGIEVTEKDVRDEIERLATKFRLSVENYLALLQEERQISPNRYGREIIWPMLALRRLVADKIQVTDEEFNREFVAQFGEAIKCRMIMVGDREKADSLRAQALSDPDRFPEIAKKYSEDETSASMGGLIPPIRRHTGDAELEEAAFALADGEISSVLPLGDQWLVLQAVRRLPASRPAPQAMPAIRAQINDRIRDQKMQGAATELFAELQAKGNVVTVLGDAEKSRQHPGIAAIVNGQPVTLAAVAQECVKHHGNEVLEGEIHRKLLQQALRKAKRQVTEDDLGAEIASAAIRYGFVRGDGSADVEAWLRSVTRDGSVTRDLYIADAVWPSVALKMLVKDGVEVTEQDLQRGFETAFGPRVEVLAIVLSDQRSAQKVWDMARGNPTDHFFGQLAAQYSVEPVSSGNFGKVPPIRKHGGQPAIEREAFKLQPGEVSGVIATGDRYVILRCQGYTDPVVKDASAVRDELMEDLRDSKLTMAMSAKFDELKSAAEIENFFEVQNKLPRVARQADAAKRN